MTLDTIDARTDDLARRIRERQHRLELALAELRAARVMVAAARVPLDKRSQAGARLAEEAVKVQRREASKAP